MYRPTSSLTIRLWTRNLMRIYRSEQRMGANFHRLYLVGYYYSLLGFIWPGRLCCRATHKRNWNPQSIRGKCINYRCHAFKRFYKAGAYIDHHCRAISLVGHAKMAAIICLPAKYTMVGGRCGRFCCYINCFYNDKFSINQSGVSKPGE